MEHNGWMDGWKDGEGDEGGGWLAFLSHFLPYVMGWCVCAVYIVRMYIHVVFMHA